MFHIIYIYYMKSITTKAITKRHENNHIKNETGPVPW